MPGKYYAVKKGRKPGVYQSWAECKAMVDGFPGAVYKSFKTREEAVAFAKAATYTGADAAPKMQNAMKKTMQQEDGAMPSVFESLFHKIHPRPEILKISHILIISIAGKCRFQLHAAIHQGIPVCRNILLFPVHFHKLCNQIVRNGVLSDMDR